MSDALSSGSSIGAGLLNYISSADANADARRQNATNNKWAPLLALNKAGSGASNVTVPKASFAAAMVPALASALNGLGSSGGGGNTSGSVGGATTIPNSEVSDPFDSMASGGMVRKQMPRSVGMQPIQPVPMAQNKDLKYAGGGMPGYSNGGGISSILGMLPMLAMLAADGGQVPGQQVVPGDSPANDTKLVAASPGEVILPKSIAGPGMKGNKWKVAAYLQSVKKHGPGPMPVKNPSGMSSAQGKTSNSMSPWAALCSGGKV